MARGREEEPVRLDTAAGHAAAGGCYVVVALVFGCIAVLTGRSGDALTSWLGASAAVLWLLGAVVYWRRARRAWRRERTEALNRAANRAARSGE